MQNYVLALQKFATRYFVSEKRSLKLSELRASPFIAQKLATEVLAGKPDAELMAAANELLSAIQAMGGYAKNEEVSLNQAVRFDAVSAQKLKTEWSAAISIAVNSIGPIGGISVRKLMEKNLEKSPLDLIDQIRSIAGQKAAEEILRRLKS